MKPFLVLAALALPFPAAAQETRASAGAKLDREFAASDANRDGFLSRTEIEARVARMQSGKAGLTPAQARAIAGLWFGRSDANRDGKLSRAESQAAMTRAFSRYDLNRDGKVSPQEQAAARARAGAGARAR